MVADSDGKPVPIGESGEILSRGYCVMLKYWNDEEKTAAAITKNNWYHSGYVLTSGYFDIGYVCSSFIKNIMNR